MTATFWMILALAALVAQGCATTAPPPRAPYATPPPKAPSADEEIKAAFRDILVGMRYEFKGPDPEPPPPAPLAQAAPWPAPAPSAPAAPPPVVEAQPAKAALAKTDERGSLSLVKAKTPPPAPFGKSGSEVKDLASFGQAEPAEAVPDAVVEPPKVELQTLPRAKSLAEALKKAGVEARFEEESMGKEPAVTVDYASVSDLARRLEERTGYFCVESGGVIVMSRLKEKTYQIGSFEKQIERNLPVLLHDPKAEANVLEGLGQVIVKDDLTGHQRIEEAIETLKETHLALYGFRIQVEKSGGWNAKSAPETVASGEISPSMGQTSTEGWILAAKKEGDRLIVQLANFEIMEEPATCIVNGKTGGSASFTVKRQGKSERFVVELTRKS